MIAISDSLRDAPPRGKLLWLRDILPFNRPGLLPNLGREDDILPYGGWDVSAGTIQRSAFHNQTYHHPSSVTTFSRDSYLAEVSLPPAMIAISDSLRDAPPPGEAGRVQTFNGGCTDSASRAGG